MTRRWGEPSNSGETKTVVRWSPYNCASPTQSTSPAPSTRGKSTTHCPCHSPRSGATRRPQLRVSSTSSTHDGARAGDGPPPRPQVPSSQRVQKPTAASTSSTSPRSATTPPRPPHCKQCRRHTLKGADLLWFLEQALRRADQPEPAAILDLRGKNTTLTGSERCASTTRHWSHYIPTTASEWTAASGRTNAWGLDGSSTCYSRTSHS